MSSVLIGGIVLIAAVAFISFAAVVVRREEPGSRQGTGAAPVAAGFPGVLGGAPPGPIGPAHLGGPSMDKEEQAPEFDEKEIQADYAVTYAKRIHLNQLFTLRVRIGGEDLSDTPEGEQVGGRGPLSFTHRYLADKDPVPDPVIRVELKYAEDEFLCTTTSLTKPFKAGEMTEFVFQIKPLKSEDLALVVEISYVGIKWVPQRATEIKVTEEDGTKTITTLMTPSKMAEDVQMLVREDLMIRARSFLNLNASTLNGLSKAAAVFLSLAYVGLAIGLRLTDEPLNAVIVGVSAVASIFGIPVGADLWASATASSGGE
jgi:hypothetical protein